MFKELTAIYKSRQNKGGFCVYAVTKSGAPSKVQTRNYNGQFEFTEDEAQVVKARMEENNPGKSWVVLPVHNACAQP